MRALDRRYGAENVQPKMVTAFQCAAYLGISLDTFIERVNECHLKVYPINNYDVRLVWKEVWDTLLSVSDCLVPPDVTSDVDACEAVRIARVRGTSTKTGVEV